MEVMCRDELVTDAVPCSVDPDATAAQVLHDVCVLFGRPEEDAALEVDGVVACVSGGGEDVEVGSLGLHADSSVVVRRSRDRVVALFRAGVDYDVLPAWVWDDERVMAEAVKCDWRALLWASARIQDAEAVVGEAVKQCGLALVHASERVQGLELVVVAAVTCHGAALEFASEAFQDTESVVAAAVTSDGTALEYASERLQDTESVVAEAVKQSAHAIEYASDRLQAA